MDNDCINIKIFPALNGDAMLVSVAKNHILIDGGYINTYKEYIRPQLKLLKEKDEALSHIIITHIDADHISGVLKLLEENSTNNIIKIENIWHNSYRHLQDFFAEATVLNLSKAQPVEVLPLRPYIKEIRDRNKNISAEQGSTLAALILQGEYAWNTECDGKAVCMENMPMLKLAEDLTLKLLSPDSQKLQRLAAFWKKELFKAGYKLPDNSEMFYDDAFEFLVAQEKSLKVIRKKDISGTSIDLNELAALNFDEDDSKTNGSSIAFEIGYKKLKILFLADAHPSLIAKSLQKLYPEQDVPIIFDAIKVSHHGSIANMSRDLLKIIDSSRFIISTDGSGANHPDLETIARIVTRKSLFKRRIYCNYPVATIESIADLQEKFNFELYISSGNIPVDINIYDEKYS